MMFIIGNRVKTSYGCIVFFLGGGRGRNSVIFKVYIICVREYKISLKCVKINISRQLSVWSARVSAIR